MRIALAQANLVVGDIAGNEIRILDAYRRGTEARADLVLCPELSITGYPPRDLLLRPSFFRANLESLTRLAAATHDDTGLVVGFVDEPATRPGRPLANAAALLHGGRIAAVRHKTLLPTYDVFDEDRYFEPARANEPVAFKGWKLGITVCEDVWNDDAVWKDPRYPVDPALALARAGATVVLADGEGVASVGAAAAAGAAGAAGTAAGADAGVAAGVESARGGVLVLGFSCDTAGAR